MILISLLALQASTLNLSLMPSGVFKRVGGYAPYAIKLSDTKPDGIKVAPVTTAPRYGTIKFGHYQFLLILDGKDKLYVDTNGDGDLTDDPAPEWSLKTYKSASGSEVSYRQGVAMVDLTIDGRVVPCAIGVYETGTDLGFYADFALAGKVTVGGQSYDALYSDPSAVWDGTKGLLMIDENRDGKFNPNTEFHPPARPFTLGGKTYEFGARGGRPAILPSTKKVEPIQENADPNEANGLRTGKAALAFQAVTTGGRAVSFPSSYRGKVVLLDFWATWCGPCMREVPNVVKAYNAYHSQGFEVLGVSLDQSGAKEQVKAVTAKNGMTWDQIYEGKYFEVSIAKQYKLRAIPEAYLIDGDTGKILAYGDGLRGAKLGPAIEKALASKKH